LGDSGRPTDVGSRELDECSGLEIARSSDDWIATQAIIGRWAMLAIPSATRG